MTKKELTRSEKLRLAGIRTYGSEKAWRASNRERGAKGGKVSGVGGFGYMKQHDPDKLKQVSSTGAKNRWKKYEEQQASQG